MEHLSRLLAGSQAIARDALIGALIDATARGTANLLPVDGAGVALLPTGVSPDIAGSDSAALRLMWLQISLGQGPCFAAHETMTAQCIPDLALNVSFPQFAAAAGYLGLSAAFAFPLRHDGLSMGALHLSRTSPGALGEGEVHAAQDLADALARDIVQARTSTVGVGDSSGSYDEFGLAQALHEERAFVASVVHEQGSSLAAISGFTDLLETAAHNLTAKQRAAVAAIHCCSDDLRVLTADLLTLLSLEGPATQSTGVREVVDLRAVVRRAEGTVFIAPTRGPSITFDVPGESVVVRGEVKQLERVLGNLLNNAIKYTPAEGTVSCVLSLAGKHAVIEVRDTGIGIPTAEQTHLFQPFFRASMAKGRPIPGAGLGLAIVAAAVRSHGGTVSLSSELGVGTHVTVRIPVDDA